MKALIVLPLAWLLTFGVANAQSADPASLLLPGYTLDASATGDIFGDGSEAFAVLSHDANSGSPATYGRADLFSCDAAGENCAPALTISLSPFDGGGLFVAQLTGDGRQQLVIYTVSGSGGFLSYQVFGIQDGQMQQLLERDGVFEGSVEPRANGLLERSSDRAWLYSWNGSEFVGTPANVSPPVPIGTVKLHYNVTATSVTGPAQVSVRVGQRLELVRDDARTDNTRILYGSDLLTVDKWPVLIATSPGNTSIDIIPRGYDWDNELKVTVHVEP